MKNNTRKKEITNIAYSLFLKNGYENTSIDEIIEKAGIAKGTFYYYFESKDDILEAVIDIVMEKSMKEAEKIMLSSLSLEQKFVNLILALRPKKRDKQIFNVIHTNSDNALHDRINWRLTEIIVPKLVLLVEEGNRIGLFNCGEVEERVRMLFVMSREFFDHLEYDEKTIRIFIETVEKMLGAENGTLEFISSVIGE